MLQMIPCVGGRDLFGGAGEGEKGVYVKLALLQGLAVRFGPPGSCLVWRGL